MWQGVPRSKNPLYTVCGLEKCVRCTPVPATPAPAKCFEWNKHMWQGVPRSKNPVHTICGLEKCVPCTPAPAAINGTKPTPTAINGTKPTPAAINGTKPATPNQCFEWNR